MGDESKNWLKALQELSIDQQEIDTMYDTECDNFWKNLSYDDQIRAFYSVMKRLTQGELKEHRSYRGILYDVFGFGPDSYGIGMSCGFMDLHNSIYTQEDIDAIKGTNK